MGTISFDLNSEFWQSLERLPIFQWFLKFNSSQKSECCVSVIPDERTNPNCSAFLCFRSFQVFFKLKSNQNCSKCRCWERPQWGPVPAGSASWSRTSARCWSSSSASTDSSSSSPSCHHSSTGKQRSRMGKREFGENRFWIKFDLSKNIFFGFLVSTKNGLQSKKQNSKKQNSKKKYRTWF